MKGRREAAAELSGTAGYLARWRPSSVSPQAADFARQVVMQAGPGGRERAKNLLWAAGRLADWGTGLGLDPVPGVLLHPSVIERFTAHGPGLTGVTRRTLRTNLRFIARAVVPQLHPADAPLPRERARAPYAPAEIGGYLALAGAQPTLARRMRAAGLVCLGARARLIRADLRQGRGAHILRPAGGARGPPPPAGGGNIPGGAGAARGRGARPPGGGGPGRRPASPLRPGMMLPRADARPAPLTGVPRARPALPADDQARLGVAEQ